VAAASTVSSGTIQPVPRTDVPEGVALFGKYVERADGGTKETGGSMEVTIEGGETRVEELLWPMYLLMEVRSWNRALQRLTS
jgi:hypothetical protein